MSTETLEVVRLADYRPFPFAVEHVRLEVSLDPDRTKVRSTLRLRRTGPAGSDLVLDGEKLQLTRLSLNGRKVARDAYTIENGALTLPSAGPDDGGTFTLEIDTEIAPSANSELSGLYMSGGRFCTQCEAEGFRRITYFPDRPDVLAPYSVRIDAPGDYPYLLSNGNPVEAGALPSGGRFAEWVDPHPKPSYLFALVAGDFDTLEDVFTTASGRRVDLRIYVDKGDAARAAFAMDSLKHAMRWDEDVFGREYDLDVFQIVAVRDFNFGAMENKGLNIFNSAYVLADGDTATDADFEAIESIVAHEYFHNWTGNRITCRDWFQLCLKEGLTVFRDQEFTKAMRSPSVARIKEVIRLRSRQFAEDAGPLAHPVRPDAYARIDNLYTATVYEKGAELIRMLRLIVGEDAFFAGMNRYFDRFDGTAATIEDFIGSFQPSTNRDLAAFAKWYGQAGTPTVTARGEHDPARRAFRLTLSQLTAPTPGQPLKLAMVTPLKVALFARDGRKIEASLDGRPADEHIALLDGPTATFSFEGVAEAPLVSLNRGFSAPVRLSQTVSDEDRILLAGMDDDAFRQWEDIQELARGLVLSAASDPQERMDETRLDLFAEAARRAVERASDDPAYAALLLFVPSVSELVLDMPDADPDRLHRARCRVQAALGKKLSGVLTRAIEAIEPDRFDASARATGRRALKSTAMTLLSRLGADAERQIYEAFGRARTMTESLGALGALSNMEGDAFDRALAAFERRWKDAPLTMDKWFIVQATAVRGDIRERLSRLVARPDFDPRTPNRARAVFAAFSMSNPVAFHAPDGWGYRFLADAVIRLDTLNPALSARLASGFESWRRFDARRRQAAEIELNRLNAAGLSKNAEDIVQRALSK
ncbi:aminopeptidase N [bacterium]|nr:aminopeptidase N [bacterium]